MSRSAHHPNAGALYRCLSRLLDPDAYEIRPRDHYEPEADCRARQELGVPGGAVSALPLPPGASPAEAP